MTQKLKDSAHKRQVAHTLTVMVPSIPFHTLVKLTDAGVMAKDKFRTLDKPLKNYIVTTKR